MNWHVILIWLALTASSTSGQSNKNVWKFSWGGNLPRDVVVLSELSLDDPESEVLLSVDRDGEPFLLPSKVGVEIDGAQLQLESYSTDTSSENGTIKSVWGKSSLYDNRYVQSTVWFREVGAQKRVVGLTVRYDRNSAIAIRYEFPKDGGWGDEVNVTGELTEFRFAGENQGWSYNGEREPLGPYDLSTPPKKEVRPPLTIKRGDGGYAAVLEAATFEQAPMTLVSTGDGGYRVKAPKSIIKNGHTSWRVILLGDEVGDLLTGPAPYVLNPPSAIEETDWIEPGLAFWDWRAWGATTDDGFTYGLDMASWRRFIDFASENNVKYLVLDANWYGPEFDKSSDPRVSRDHLVIQPDRDKPQVIRKPAPEDWEDPIDVPALIKYGKERNVGIILYINDVARKNYPFEETLALYEEWGAAGIKYGFMEGRGQQKVRTTREIIRLCAKHHLLCNFHDGPVPPSGDERTYPNYIAREFCHAQADAMRSFTPTAFCKTVFVNMLAGPLDMNNGLFALNNPAKDRPRFFKNIESTVVSECARVLITYTGMAILPDTPEAYAEKADLFEFLSRLPMDWDETQIVNGSIGEYITSARRGGDTWYVASATNEEGRTLDIDLDFLKPGTRYRATLYEDAPDSHFQTNREAYRVRKVEGLTSDDKLEAMLAPGGGHCVILEPAE